MARPSHSGDRMAAADASAGRLFFGVPLDESTRRAVLAHLESALGGECLPGRTVAPGNLHITVRFLGDTDREVSQRIVGALRALDLGTAFEVEFDRLGAFPNPRRARVLWLGIAEGREPLRLLAETVERIVQSQGIPADERPFAAHLTLSRLKPEADVRALIERVPGFAIRFPVTEVVLFRSHLSPSGPRYEALEHFPLSRPS